MLLTIAHIQVFIEQMMTGISNRHNNKNVNNSNKDEHLRDARRKARNRYRNGATQVLARKDAPAPCQTMFGESCVADAGTRTLTKML